MLVVSVEQLIANLVQLFQICQLITQLLKKGRVANEVREAGCVCLSRVWGLFASEVPALLGPDSRNLKVFLNASFDEIGPSLLMFHSS